MVFLQRRTEQDDRVRYWSLPVPQVDRDRSDGGNSWIVLRNNSPPDGLAGSDGLPPLSLPPLSRLSPVVVASVAVSSVSLLPPAVLVQADRIEARHVDSLSNLQEFLRDLVGRDCEENRPYRDPAIICLSGCGHRGRHSSGGE